MHVAPSLADKVLHAWLPVHDFISICTFIETNRSVQCNALCGCHVGLAVGRQASWLVDLRSSAARYSALLS